MFAPLPLQDGFDNAGLQIGLTDAEATGALLCLDVTEAVVDEAVTLGYNLIVSHHPLIFKGYKSITGKDYVERCIMKAIKNDITIFSMHTNLDNAPQGVNYKIAEKIGLQNIRILDPKENALLKLVTFVPAKWPALSVRLFSKPVADVSATMMHAATMWTGKGLSEHRKEHIPIAARSVNFTRNLKPGLKQSCLPICEVLSRKPCWLFILTKNRPMTFILWPIRGIR